MPTLAQLASPKSLSSSELSALLREREAAQAGGQVEPGSRDIYQYIDNQGTTFGIGTPNQTMGGDAGVGSSVTAPWETVTSGGGDNATQQLVPTVDPRFRDAVTLFQSNAGGEGSGGWQSNVDPSKLPQTRFGNVTLTAPVSAHTPLANPNLVYDDPVYGRITDARNVRPDPINAMASAALMSAAMAGVGYLGAPTLATSLVNLARTFGNGGNGIGDIIGMVGDYFNLPSWGTSLAQLAGNQLLGGKRAG